MSFFKDVIKDVGGVIGDIGGLVGGVGSIVGGAKQIFGDNDGGEEAALQAAGLESDAALRAAGIQRQSDQEALAELRRQFDLSQGLILEQFGLGKQQLQRQNQRTDLATNLLQPFVGAGQNALTDLQQGATVGGLDERLAQIFNTDIFQSLVDERTRAAQGQLAAGGLTRSGAALEDIANIPTELGLALENQLFGRSQNLAAGGQNAAGNIGALATGQAPTLTALPTNNAIAQTLSQSGANQAAGLRNSAAATASGILTGQQAQAAAQQNAFNTAATLGSIFFSDPNLKENIESIGKINDLTLVQWDWIKEAKTISLIAKDMTIGFLTTEVKQKYPHHVYEVCGFDTIDYPHLLDELEAA